MAIELYVMVSVLSRTTSILENDKISDKDKEYVKTLTEMVSRDCRQNFTRNLKRLGQTYDKLIPKASKAVDEREGYGLDIIHF